MHASADRLYELKLGVEYWKHAAKTFEAILGENMKKKEEKQLCGHGVDEIKSSGKGVITTNYCGACARESALRKEQDMDNTEQYEKLRQLVLEMDERFGHFAVMHDPKADADPAILLGDLANLVHKAAQYCRGNRCQATNKRRPCDECS